MELETHVLVALASAEAKDLCIVPNKGDTLAGVCRSTAEITSLDPHLCDGSPVSWTV